MLLSNTSFIEALFSYICSLSSCNARSYPTQIASRGMRETIKAIEKSSSYSANEYLPEPEMEDMHHTPCAIMKLNKDIENQKREWLQIFEFKLLTNVTSIPPLTLRDFSHFEAPFSKYVYLHIMNRSFDYHFTKMIARQTFFANYYSLMRYSN